MMRTFICGATTLFFALSGVGASNSSVPDTTVPTVPTTPPAPPKRVGEAFTKPFKSTEVIRQRCISLDVLGCSPNEPAVPDGAVRHLLVEGDDGDLWMHFQERGTVNTQSIPVAPAEAEIEVYEEEEDAPLANRPAAAMAQQSSDEDLSSSSSSSSTEEEEEEDLSQQQDSVPTLDAWTYRGIVTVDGVQYHNYTAAYEALVGPEADSADLEEARALIESGLVPNFHEYLEDLNGNPFRMRDYSITNEWKLYRETVFLAVVPLSQAQVDEYNVQQAQKEGAALRRKLSGKRETTVRATQPSSLRRRTHSLPEEGQSANDEHERRLRVQLSGGIEVPRGCLNSNDDSPCFALHAFETTTTVNTRLRFTIGAKKDYKTKRAGKIKGSFGAVLDGKMVLDKSNGDLMELDVNAHGCAEFAKSIGILSAGVEFCMQGSVKMVPQGSINGRIDMWASVFAELLGRRLSFKVAGGSLAVNAVYLDGGYRLKEITGYIWRRQRFGPAYVGAGVKTKSWPHDARRADNWQTNVYFNGFAGIDLWLWSDEVGFDIKIAQIGPEKRKEVSAPPEGLLSPEDKQDLADLAEQLAKAKAAVSCDSQCIVETTAAEYVAFRLPGGKADDSISFPSIRYVGTAPERWLVDEAHYEEHCHHWAPVFYPNDCPKTRCEGFTWTDIEYTCVFNEDVQNPSASWQRSGDFRERSGFFGKYKNKEDCFNDLSHYTADRETVTNGVEFVYYGLITWNSPAVERLIACGEVPDDAEHIELMEVEYNPAEEPFVRDVGVPQKHIGVVSNEEDQSCLYPFGVACCSGSHEVFVPPETLETEEVTTMSLDLRGADINVVAPPDSTFFLSANDLVDLGFSVDDELDLSVTDFAIGTSFFDAPYNPVSSDLASYWTLPGSVPHKLDPHLNEYVNVAYSYHEFVYDYYWKARADLVMVDGSRHSMGEVQGRISGAQFFPKVRTEMKTCFWCNSTNSMCGIFNEIDGETEMIDGETEMI